MKSISILIFFVCSMAYAGKVRDLYLDEYTIAPAYLKLGRTTVLRFEEKPLKVISGNSSHFSLEYIGNDIAVQPLGQTSTNFFIYTKNRSFGIYLHVQNKRHDDLVKIFWKDAPVSKRKIPKGRTIYEIKLKENLSLDYWFVKTGHGLKIVDFNITSSNKLPSKLKVFLGYKSKLKRSKVIEGKREKNKVKFRGFVESNKNYFPYLVIKTNHYTYTVSLQRRKLLRKLKN